MSRHVVATAYLQIAHVSGSTYDRDRNEWDGKGIVRNVTNNRPDTVLPGCIVVKVRLRVPAAGWEPFTPEAVIDVPADLVQRPVEVEAVTP